MNVLKVQNLRTHFHTPAGIARAVDGISFELKRGESLAIVGESGCGKTVLATTIMRLFRHSNVFNPTGEIYYNGVDLLKLSPPEMETIRGRNIAMIFQEPMAALNPVWKIKDQIAEPLLKHLNQTKKEAYARALELLKRLGVPSPERVMETHPHTLSGGMRQRVAIAMALACKPDILVADEPTTALDVTVQAQILRLIREMQDELGMAVIMITHDLGVVNETSDRVMVMYSGRTIETGKTKEVLFSPQHPYTEKLIAAVPSLDETKGRLAAIEGQVRAATRFVEGCRFADRCPHAQGPCLTETPPALYGKDSHQVACYLYDSAHIISRKTDKTDEPLSRSDKPIQTTKPILAVDHVKTWFPVHGGLLRRHVADVKAVDDISFSINQGDTLALVGESGCGKSTLGQTILRLVEATSGKVMYLGRDVETDILSSGRQELRSLRTDLQIIFQDPFASLNPRFSVREIIEEGLKIHQQNLGENERLKAMEEVLTEVGLPSESLEKYPHEFSGGQRQRIAIARAMILRPKILILDEATSALDVSIQAQVLNLLRDLQSKYRMTMIFITHNLGVVRYIATHIAVMYLGKVVEFGETKSIMSHPQHPYTEKLISSIPRLQPDAKLADPLEGDVPSSIFPPSGCPFHPRCPKFRKNSESTEFKDCRDQQPHIESKSGHQNLVSCHHPNP